MVDFKKYKRVFAFGCSFTSYAYPTWADVLMDEMPDAECYNLGKSGAGNHFIACRIAEANTRFKFTDTDLVMVMYSTAFREDRYIEGGWKTFGNIYHQDFYNENFVKNYVDPVGCVIRDLALIEMSKRYLEMLPCSTLFFRASSLEEEMTTLFDDDMKKVVELYKDVYNDFPPTLRDTMFPKGWQPSIKRGEPDNPYMDCHPMPLDYYDYLIKLGFNLSQDRSMLEEANKKAHQSNPDYSNWHLFFPKVEARQFRANTQMF